MYADASQLTEAMEESVKVAAKKHESALITEQSKLIDLQSVIDCHVEVSISVQLKIDSYLSQVSNCCYCTI